MSLVDALPSSPGGATGIEARIARVLAERGARIAIVQPVARTSRRGSARVAGCRGVRGRHPRRRPGGEDDRSSDRAFRRRRRHPGEQCELDRTAGARLLRDGRARSRARHARCERQRHHLVLAGGGGAHDRHWAGGSIVHIASVGAFAAQELASIICASKAAQVSLAQSMAIELAPHGIRVNAVAPGDILTPANAEVVADMKALGGTGKYLRRTPLERRGTPREIGEAVAFLVSDEARFITGATLRVDGGFLTY